MARLPYPHSIDVSYIGDEVHLVQKQIDNGHHYSQRKSASTRNLEYYKALNLALASHYCVTNAFMSMYNQAVNVRWELRGVLVHSNRFGIISDAGSKIFDGICLYID